MRCRQVAMAFLVKVAARSRGITKHTCLRVRKITSAPATFCRLSLLHLPLALVPTISVVCISQGECRHQTYDYKAIFPGSRAKKNTGTLEQCFSSPSFFGLSVPSDAVRTSEDVVSLENREGRSISSPEKLAAFQIGRAHV